MIDAPSISTFNQKVAVSGFTQTVAAALSVALIDAHREKGWGQAEIAQRLGVDPVQISDWFNGRHQSMTLETVALLAAALDHEPEFLLRKMNGDERG